MQTFNYALLALFVGALLVSACRIEPSTFKGDVTSLDVAVRFENQGEITLPAVSFGGSGFSFMMDVFPRDFQNRTGCLFSSGNPDSNEFVEARMVNGEIHLTIGKETAKTYRILDLNRWQNIIFSVDSSEKTPAVKVFVNGQSHTVDNGLTGGLPVADRSLSVGLCQSTRLNADIDNFIVFSKAVEQEEAEWFTTQFFPQVLSDSLVFYFSFNDVSPGVGGISRGHAGSSTNSFMKAKLLDNAVGVLKKGGNAAPVADTTCQHQGVAMAKVGDNKVAYPPFFNPKSTKGGATATARCMDGDKTMFTVQQLWDPKGGISEMTVKTSSFHYWRISANGLKVEHRTWGGWHVVPRGADLIDYDKTTYKFTDDAIVIQSGHYGYVRITERNGHLNYEMGVNTHYCELVGAPTRKSWCDHMVVDEATYDFSNEPVPEMPFGHKSDQPGVGGPPVLACPPPSEQYRPDDLLPPPPPPPPPPIKLPPPPVDVKEPCDAYGGSKVSQFETTCGARYTVGSTFYQRCLDECCLTGTCPKSEDDCSSQRILASTNEGFEIDPKCETGGCPNQCSDGGVCLTHSNGSKYCECDEGRAGPDCSQETWFPCFRATAPGENVAVRPMSINSGNSLIFSEDTTFSKIASFSEQFEMEDTVIIYLTKTAKKAAFGNDYHIVILNSNGDGRGSGESSYDLTMNGVDGAKMYVNGNVVADSIDANSRTQKLSWMFNTKSVAYITNLPDDFDATFTISNEAGNANQFLIGSQHKGSDSGKMEVVKHDMVSKTISISGKSCNNNCADVTTCAECAALPECGWCAETNQCLGGDASGPVFSNATCANWRFTFDNDVTRRVTQEFSWPVNPGMTEVVFSTAPVGDKMPLELKVDMGKPHEIQWDVAFLSSWTGNHKSAWRGQIDNLLSALTSYPNLAIGIASLDSSSSGFDVVKVLSNPRDNYWFKKHIEQSNVAVIGKAKLFTAIEAATTTNGNALQWRQGARKLLVVTADHDFDFNLDDVKTLKETLVKRDIIPVFAVTPAHKSSYEKLVAQLGFGFVEDLASDMGNLRAVSIRSIDNAAGHAAAVQTDVNDHIDTNAWNDSQEAFRMRSLTHRHVARFSVPVSDQTTGPNALSRIHMPAFGVAKIDDVESDKPTAKAFPSRSVAKEDTDQIIELQGRSFRNILDVYPVIKTMPASGELYQVVMQDGKPVAGDRLSSNTVTDELGRVAYRPPLNSGKMTDSFTFVISDGCTESGEVTVNIEVLEVNDAPVTSILPPSGKEDEGMVIFLDGSDAEDNDLTAYVTMGLHGMTEDGTKVTDVDNGRLFQYSNAVTQSPDNAGANDLIDTTDGPVEVTDSLNRVVYWPKTHANSHASYDKTPELLIKPCLEYKVVEISTPEKLESDVRTVPVDIRPVNDAPLIWADTSADTSDYTFDWTTIGEDFGCFETGPACTFDEDFGSKYPWDAEYKYLYLGGGDVEKSQLSVKITTFLCPDDAIVQNDLIGDRNIEVGDEMIDNDPNTLSPLIRFRPGPDGNNENSKVVEGEVYCRIGYKLVDEQGMESVKEHTIDISITPQPDVPRLSTSDSDITAIEKIPKSFSIEGVDPEGIEFSTFIVSCGAKGVLQYCVDSSCVKTGIVDCANLPSEGLELPSQPLKDDLTSTKRATPMIFTSDKIYSLSEGTEYNTLDVVFRDTNGKTSDPFEVTINVISINDAPKVIVNNLTDGEISISAPDERAAPSVAVNDSDIGNGVLDLTITLTGEDSEGRVSIDTSVFEDNAIKTETKDKIEVRGRLVQINEALSAFSVTGTKFKNYKVEITANDNGYFGQCPDFNGEAKMTGKLCPLESKTTLEIEFVDQNLVNIAIIAGAGAGVLAIAAAGAVGATQLFNSKAANADYSPWDAFDTDGAAVANPLYESGAVGGENRIFDAGSDYQNADSYL